MFERTLRLSAALCAACAAQLGAQSVRSLEARIDSLALAVLHADSAAKAYGDSIAKVNAASDTVRFGLFQFTTQRSLVAIDREVASIVEGHLRQAFGNSVARLAGYRVSVRESQPRFGRARDTTRVMVGYIFSTGREVASVETGRDAKAIAQAIENWGVQQLTGETGSEFTKWLGAWIPTDTLTADAWAADRLLLVSSLAAASRRCYDGTLADCEAVLGFRATADPVTDWYDASGRLEAVRRLEYGLSNTQLEAKRRCLAGDDQSCQATLRSTAFNPFKLGSLRASLLRHAAKLGGDGAYERLIEAQGGPRERLSAAAGVPFDSLMRSWQANIHDARVPSGAMRPSIALASLGWMLVCAGLSLRSPRWR